MERKLTLGHLKQYKTGGDLQNLFNVVENDPELSFEIRVNDEVKIYYCKKVVATISKGKKVKPLNSKYCKDGKVLNVDISDKNTWKDKDMIRKYFNQAKDIVYKNSKKAEFAIQQNISLGSRSFDNGLVVVDMEWQLPQVDIPIENRIPITRIDLVAVNPKVNENGENDIFLVEVKHTLDATSGNSGMQDHVDKTYNICNCSVACEALIKDVNSIIEQKIDLGIITGHKPILRFSKVPKMMFFLSYRNNSELESLKKQISSLKIPVGMDKPVVQYNNYTIQLSL